jgi:hypothetical protein
VVGGAAALLVVRWVLAKGLGDTRQFATVSMNGITRQYQETRVELDVAEVEHFTSSPMTTSWG